MKYYDYVTLPLEREVRAHPSKKKEKWHIPPVHKDYVD